MMQHQQQINGRKTHFTNMFQDVEFRPQKRSKLNEECPSDNEANQNQTDPIPPDAEILDDEIDFQMFFESDQETAATPTPEIPPDKIDQFINKVTEQTRISYEYIPLEADRIKREQDEKEFIEAGILLEDKTPNPNYVCQLCHLPDDFMQEAGEENDVMSKIYEYERYNFKREPDKEIFKKMANKFNSTIYLHDKKFSHRNRIDKISSTQVKFHIIRENTRDGKRAVAGDLEFLDNLAEEVRYNHILYREVQGDTVLSKPYISLEMLNAYFRLDKRREDKQKQLRLLLDKEDADLAKRYKQQHQKHKTALPSKNFFKDD